MHVCFNCQRDFPTATRLNQHIGRNCGRAGQFREPPPRHRTESPPPAHQRQEREESLGGFQEDPPQQNDWNDAGAGGNEAEGRGENGAGGELSEEEPDDRFPGLYEGEQRWYEQLDPEPPFQGNLFHPFHSFEQWDTADTLYRQKANEAFQKEQLDRDYLAGKDTFSSVKKLQDAYDALPNDIPFRQVTIEPVWPPDLSPEQIANLPASLKEPQVFAARNIIEVAKYLAEDEDLVHGSRYQARTLINKYGQRVVKEACDGARWKNLESQLPLDQTLLYGVFSSDKVNLTSAPNRKAGYPGYFTLGNLSSDNRILINNENLIKIADYPVFDKIPDAVRTRYKKEVRLYKEAIMRSCFETLFQPLFDSPVFDVDCSDNKCRHCRLIVAAILADNPEQHLLAATITGRCPICMTPFGRLERVRPPRTVEDSRRFRFGPDAAAASTAGYRWFHHNVFENLPMHDICASFSPDLLHMVLKPLKDYIIDWIEEELDQMDKEDQGSRSLTFTRRLQLQFHFPELQHFGNGVSFSPWSGNDSRGAKKILVGCLEGLDLEEPTLDAVRIYVEMMFLARLPGHTDRTPPGFEEPPLPPPPPHPPTLDVLDELSHELQRVLANGAFPRARPPNTRFHRLVRLHMMMHLAPGIREFGALLALSTDAPEHRHQIDEKSLYNQTSKHRAAAQILKRNARHLGLHQVRRRLVRAGIPILAKERAALEKAANGEARGRPPAPKPSQAGFRITQSQPVVYHRPDQLPDIYALPSFENSVFAFLRQGQNAPLSRELLLAPVNTVADTLTLEVLISKSLTIHYRTTDLTFDPTAAPSFEAIILRSDPKWTYKDEGTDKNFKAPRYDFAAVRVEDGGGIGRPIIRVARIRLIFSLHGQNKSKSEGLALVEWLRREGNAADPSTGLLMYRKEMRRGQVFTSIIPVTNIIRPVHLQPRLASPISPIITRTNVFERTQSFFLNARADDDLWSWFRLNTVHFTL